MTTANRSESLPHHETDSRPTLHLKSRGDIEREIQRQVEEERRRLELQHSRKAAHFKRPTEKPFTAAERDKVTILIGGLTWKHEWLIRSVFQSAGYKTEI